jgi:hypothetical protein
MKFLIVTAFVLMGNLTANSAFAKTQCVVYVASKGPGICQGAMSSGPEVARKYSFNSYFIDTDGLANLNAARCIDRAQEYATWCGIKVTAVATHFQVDGKNVIAGYATGGKTYIHDGVARLTRYHD